MITTKYVIAAHPRESASDMYCCCGLVMLIGVNSLLLLADNQQNIKQEQVDS